MTGAMYYSVTGTGKSLLFIHGWAMHTGIWTDFVKDFSHAYQIICVDLRGHGKSAALPGPYTFTALADDIAQLVVELNLQKVTLAGWSMGVSILLKMLLHIGHLVDSLVCISGNPSFVQRNDYRAGVPEVSVRRLYRQIDRDYPDGLTHFFKLLFTPEELSVLKNNKHSTPALDLTTAPVKQAALETLDCFRTEDLRGVLPGIQVPTLIIHGSEDRVCMPEAARYMHTHITNSQMLLLNDTGHVPFITKKTEVHQAIHDFLKSIN